MATTTKLVAVAALVLAIVACHGGYAQSPAPETFGAPSPAGGDCFAALTNMSDCLTFVQDGSKLTKPDKGCCPELAGLVDSHPICLCKLLGKPDSIGIKIDLKKAMKLPSVCGVTTPPVSTCSAVGVPVSTPPSMSGDSMSPSMSPEGSATPSNAAGVPSGMSPEGSATPSNAAGVPSGGPSPSSNSSEDKNGASGIQASALTFIFGLSTLSVSIFL